MGKFLVRWGTFQGGPNIVMITGNRLFGLNLPPRLAAWLNKPSVVNAIASADLGPTVMVTFVDVEIVKSTGGTFGLSRRIGAKLLRRCRG
jgi:hypothetical protein